MSHEKMSALREIDRLQGELQRREKDVSDLHRQWSDKDARQKKVDVGLSEKECEMTGSLGTRIAETADRGITGTQCQHQTHCRLIVNEYPHPRTDCHRHSIGSKIAVRCRKR